MQKIIFVGFGGFIGAISRYLITIFFSKVLSSNIPIGTLFVNIIGGLLIGFIMQFSLNSTVISDEIRLLLTTGILGGLTTFSTFSYETISIFSKGNFTVGIVNILLNVFLSLSGVIIGKSFARFF